MKPLTISERFRLAQTLGNDWHGNRVISDDELGEVVKEVAGIDVYEKELVGDSIGDSDRIKLILKALPVEAVFEVFTALLELAKTKVEYNQLSVADERLEECTGIIARFKQAEGTQAVVNRRVPIDNGDDEALPFEGQFQMTNKTFNSLMLDRKLFQVPPYQRAFCWTTSHFEQLWLDVESLRQNGNKHFMGFMVFRHAGDGRVEVIDGQQRLVTLLIMVLAGISRISHFIKNGAGDEEDRHNYEELRRMIVPPSHSNPMLGLRMVLGSNDYLQLRMMVAREDSWSFGAANRNMADAFDYFHDKMQAFNDSQEVSRFFSTVLLKTYFTEVFVFSAEMAYMLFDTLNNRGVQLSGADLMKNYMFSLVDPQGEGTCAEQADDWEHVMRGLKQTDFREYFNAVVTKIGKANGARRMLPKVKAIATDREAVSGIIKELLDNLPAYHALRGSSPNYWVERSQALHPIKEMVTTLNDIDVVSHLGLALAGIENFSKPADLVTFMRFLIVMAIRYQVVCRRENLKLERLYGEIAARMRDERLSLHQVAAMLRREYPDDEYFKEAFTYLRASTKSNARLARYLLLSLETQLSKGTAPSFQPTIEHVLPQALDNAWRDSFNSEVPESHVDRLGNLALLPQQVNMALGVASYAEKRAVLLDSEFEINKHLAKADEWTMATLDAHQAFLAKTATSIWKLPSYDD